MSVRVAGLAIVAVQISAALSQPGGLDAPIVGAILFALQGAAVVWTTSRRSTARLRLAAPPALAGVSAAALWTAVAFAVPVSATGNATAVVAIVAAGLAVAVLASRRRGPRLLPLVLIASASTALM